MLKKVLLAAIFVLTQVQTVSAQLTNPVLGGDLGSNTGNRASSGATFLSYFVTLWRAIIFIGGLAVVGFFVMGAIEWITAGGDQAKVGKARDKITQAVIGLVLLVGSFVIIGFIGNLFFGANFDLLNLVIPTPGGP